MENLEGKTAFVTGASQGIGRACALALAKMGARVALAARNEANLEAVASEITAAGGQAKAFVVDVASEASIQAAAKTAIAHFGSVEILVNNAGILLDKNEGNFFNTDLELVRQTMETNVYGPYLLCQALVPLMKKKARSWNCGGGTNGWRIRLVIG